MAKYRKKPIIIEANQFFEDKLPHPVGVYHGIATTGDKFLNYYVVPIHGQTILVFNGDWIITEPDGDHHYPCKPDIFAKTFDPI